MKPATSPLSRLMEVASFTAAAKWRRQSPRPRRHHAERVRSPDATAWQRSSAWGTRVLTLLLLLASPTMLKAQFSYTTNDGAITITGYSGPGGAVTIPSETNGLPVTGIGSNTFSTEGRVTSITIPDSVTCIEGQAFYECYNLTNVNIPDSVTNIGEQAFYLCESLTRVTIPDSVTSIGVSAFGDCFDLPALTVDPQNLFYSSVDGILFDKSQTTLIQCPGGKAGAYTVPAGTTSIADSAFVDCGLSSVTIPDSVTSIGETAFATCSSLSAITVGSNNPAFSSVAGVLFDKSQTTLIQYPIGNKAQSYTIPDSVTSIEDRAFMNCRLTSITIPDSVTSIGNYVFNACQLTEITIPDSVTNLGNNGFCWCFSLTSVTIGNGVPSIEQGSFWNCPSLTNLTIGSSVTNIASWGFIECSGLTSVTIPASVTSIGGVAFSGCTSLKSLYYLGNAPSVDSTAFSGDNATAYYLPGTTGWAQFAANTGIATALWTLPSPLVLNGSVGAQTIQFGFTVSWATNLSVVVEACTNLANPVWQPLQTNTLTNGTFYFSDPQWTNYPARFYRITAP